MGFQWQLLLSLCLATGTWAAPRGVVPASAAVKESVDLPSGWNYSGTPSPDHQLKISLLLKQSNISGLKATLDDLANPNSANFRNWLSLEEMQAYTAPSADTLNSVTTWLAAAGINSSAITQPNVDIMQLNIPVSQAESLLNTTYKFYTHYTSNTPVARALTYSLPTNLHQHIDSVQPTTAFVHKPKSSLANGNAARRRASSRKRSTYCDAYYMTPSCLAAEYNIDWTPSNLTGAQVATVGVGSAPASHVDAEMYSLTLGNDAPVFIDVSVDGAYNTGESSIEGNLDTQLSAGIANPNQAYYISVGTSSSDSFTSLVGYLTQGSAPPAVSISYLSDESTSSGDYLDRICNGFAQAASMGITVMAASGDWGVGSIRNDASCSSFVPSFPSTCPYVLSVGGTTFNTTDVFEPHSSEDPGETAAWFTASTGTGGGFSNHFAMPSYQQTAVSAYIQALDGEWDGMYNASGRAYPDVSSLSVDWYIPVNGTFEQIFGTSAAAPSWAAMISIINDYLISEGLTTVGWVQPSLYSFPGGTFNDITTQSTRGCGGSGFPALSGWDAATGLGTPNFPNLRSEIYHASSG